MLRSLLRLVVVIGVAGTGLAGTLVAAIPQVSSIAGAHHATATLPPFRVLNQRSVMYDSKGAVIAYFDAGENRSELASLDDVPWPVIQAVLAVEDTGFWRHRGVNARSLMRAMLANVSAGGVRQGGSTITQQLVKNAMLSSDRNADRKLVEAADAVRLERELPKTEILLRYLNTVYFGNGAYGLIAAAETYYGKPLGQLTLVEAAFMAGLIKAPSAYDPFLHPDAARTRRAQVLSRLVDLGLLSDRAANAEDATPVPFRSLRPQDEALKDTYFVAAARQQLLSEPWLGADDQARYDALFRGGLKITATFDPSLQADAEQSRNEILPRDPKDPRQWEAAIASIDPQTGAVRAMVGGPGFSKWKYDLTLQNNRQVGSTFKVFDTVAALEAGVQPDDTIDGGQLCSFPNPGGRPNPYNSPGRLGLAPLRQQLINSVNCAFTRLGSMVGGARVIDTAHRMGIASHLTAAPSMFTGDVGLSPMEMASAFGTLAAGGVHHPWYLVEKIETADGQLIYQHSTAGDPAVDPKVAATAVSMMKGVVDFGTGRNAHLADRPAAGKTGTDDNYRNAWFVGFTPQLVTAVWMGSPYSYEPMVRVGGHAFVTGGDFPALMWHRYMILAMTGQPVIDFPKAPGDKRPPARLYLPGVECTIDASKLDPNATTIPPSQTTTTRAPRTTTPRPGTAIDRNAPVPSVPLEGVVVFPCKDGPPEVSTTAPPDTVPETTVPPTGTTTGRTTTTTVPTTTVPVTQPPTTAPTTAPSTTGP